MKRILSFVILFAVATVASAFPARFVVEHFLGNYLGALDVLFYLFAGQIFFTIIKCIYVNLYKARQMQRVYFSRLAVTIAVGAALNTVCFSVLHRKEAFSLGTLLSAVFWFLLCQKDFPDLRLSIKQYIYLLIETVLFLTCGQWMPAIYGFCTYVIGSVIITMLLMRPDFLAFLQLPLHFIQHRQV